MTTQTVPAPPGALADFATVFAAELAHDLDGGPAPTRPVDMPDGPWLFARALAGPLPRAEVDAIVASLDAGDPFGEVVTRTQRLVAQPVA